MHTLISSINLTMLNVALKQLVADSTVAHAAQSQPTDDVMFKIFLTSLPVAASILLALTGYVFTSIHQKRVAERTARLERVNLQLRKLYGPLYAELQTGQAVWAAFAQNFWPAHGQRSYFAEGYATTKKEREVWRHWMTYVFQPHNERIERIILENGDLLEEPELPPSFINLMTHVATYKAVIQKWAKKDFSQIRSISNFPGLELMLTVEPVYHALRNEQVKLLGQLSKKKRNAAAQALSNS
jgi:hypothetical protein